MKKEMPAHGPSSQQPPGVRPPSWGHQTAEHSPDLACFLFCSEKFYWNTLCPFTEGFFMAAFM